jgi:hypothetical protein
MQKNKDIWSVKTVFKYEILIIRCVFLRNTQSGQKNIVFDFFKTLAVYRSCNR